MDLHERMRESASSVCLSEGMETAVLDNGAVRTLAREFSLEPREVEIAALNHGLAPTRYLRNFEAYTFQAQARMLSCTLVQVGLGGLGGILLEMFARTGIGIIRAADGDVFAEHNANRQLLCTEATYNQSKAAAAAERVTLVNPSVAFSARDAFVEADEMDDFIAGADLVVDALGGLKHRLALQQAAARAGVPLVTGAMAGWTGYAAVVLPGQPGPADFMGDGSAAEDRLGTQAPVVYGVAASMAGEAIKLLSGEPSGLAGKMLLMDYARNQFELMTLVSQQPPVSTP